MTRRQYRFFALLAIVVLISVLVAATHGAPALPTVTPTWTDQHTLILSWQQHSDANRATVMRCARGASGVSGASGASCYLVAGFSTQPGAHAVTDRNATAGDVYWIGEFISSPDGDLTILGWTGPIRVPDRLTRLPSIRADPTQ